MNLKMILPLFTLFSGEEDTERYLPLLRAAVQEVLQELREDADSSDIRLCYLAAAVANLRYTQLFGAREKALATYAGTIARESSSEQQIRFAAQLVYSYKKLCADLVEGMGFVFSGIRGECFADTV